MSRTDSSSQVVKKQQEVLGSDSQHLREWAPPRTISRQLNHCELAVAHIPKFRARCEGGYAVRDAIVTTEGAGNTDTFRR